MPFAEAQAARLDEARLATVMARVDADLMLGRHAELVAELATLALSYPLHEGVCAPDAQPFRSGRKADALKAFRRAQQVFIDELGIDPGRQLTDLQAAILSADPKLEWQPSRSTPSNSTARGIPVGAAEQPTARDSVKSSPRRRPPVWNVPARNPRFTGRTDLINQLHDALHGGSTRPSTQALYGLGGVGKTQLVDLVWWVDAEQPVLIPDQLIASARQWVCRLMAAGQPILLTWFCQNSPSGPRGC